MLVRIKVWELPHGDPSSWTLEQETYGTYLAKHFAREYVYDFDERYACIRLGCGEKIAGKIGGKLLNHPLVQHYIRKEIGEFAESRVCTKDSLMARLWREANNDSYGTANSRVAAAQQLGKILRLTDDKQTLEILDKTADVNRPISKEEFEEMKEVFDEEY